MWRRLGLIPLAALGFATAFLVAGAGSAVTSVELVATGAGGVSANASSGGASVSDDGRFVAFHSGATNLPGIDGNGSGLDVFVRDRTAAVTERLTGGNGASGFPSISDDGRFVVFQSAATDIAAPDPNTTNSDVFLYDLVTDVVVRLAPAANGVSSDPAISGNGNFVAFTSTSTNLTPGGSDSAPDVYRWTRADGTIEKMSQSTSGIPGAGGGSFEPAISDDGNLVAFATDAVNLTPFPGDVNNETDIYLRNVSAGTTDPVGVNNAGALPPSSPFTFGASVPAISGDGRYVAFDSWSAGLTGATNGLQVYLRDRTLATTTRISTGNGNIGGTGPVAISDNGHVFFQAIQQLVAGGSTAFRPNVYAYEIVTGSLARVSLTPACENGTSASSSSGARNVSVSDDGATVAFENSFTNLPGAVYPSVVASTLDSTTCTPTGNSDTSIPPSSTGTTSSSTTTTTTTTTTPEPTPTIPATPTFELPVRAVIDLVVTKTASNPASGDAFAPGEAIVYTVDVVNAGTRDAFGIELVDRINVAQLGSGAPEAAIAVEVPSNCSQGPSPELGGPLVAATALECRLGNIPAGGGRVTVSYTARVTGSERFRVDNRAFVPSFFALNDADFSDNADEAEVAVDTGERECEPGETCESQAGITETTCEGEGTVCKYGGQGVMNTVCSGEVVCGGGPLGELHICSAGATCKDKRGQPNVFRCSGEDTFCAGIGTFTCTNGASCRVWGEGSTATCTSGSTLDLRGTDNTARANGCTASVAEGNNVRTVGNGANRVRLLGAGDLIRTGSGRIFVDAINGRKNVIVCNGGNSTVRADGKDDPRDCETVIGADIRPSVYGGKTTWGWHIRNRGPADATQVRVIGRFSIERGSILSSSVRSSEAKCTIEETDTTAGATVIVDCLIPTIEARSLVGIGVSLEPTSDWKQIVQEVVANAGAPVDHKPENNDWSRVDENDGGRAGAR